MDIVVSQLLVLVLLFVANFRVFGKNKKNQEVFVVLAPVSLVLSILLIFAWGLTLPTLLILILSFLTCLINFYSLLRFFSKLMTGYYGIGLFVFSVLFQVLIVLTAVFIIITIPVSTSLEKLSVEEKTISIVGSYGIGFTERTLVFDRIDGKVSVYSPILETQADEIAEVLPVETGEFVPEVPETQTNEVAEVLPVEEKSKLPLVFIVSDPRENSSRLKPFASKLASKGYEVIVADFFTSPFESFGKRFLGVAKKEYFVENNTRLVQMAVGQYAALLEMFNADGKERSVYLVGDGICGEAAERVFQLKPDVVSGFYSLNGNTSNGPSQNLLDWHQGFGFLGETAPHLLWILGSTDNLFECRDEMGFNSVLAVAQAQKVFVSENIVSENMVKE